jgi:hypothetical protein
MLPIACPKPGAIQHGSRSYQGIAQFETVTLAILPEIVASLASNFSVDWNTNQRPKKVGHGLMLRRTSIC